MSQPTKGAVVAGPQAVDLDENSLEDQELTPKTAAELRELCNKTGEEFDGNLTELQAKRRIAALNEAHNLS